MNVKYIIQKHNKYWFQRRPPKALHNILGDKVIRTNLQTSDLSTAVARRDIICSEWSTMLEQSSPSQGYRHYRDMWSRAKVDLTEHDQPLVNEDILLELEMAGLKPAVDPAKILAKFSVDEQAAFHALNSLRQNTPPPAEFAYSVRDGLRAIVEQKQGTITDTFLAKFGIVVDLFLGVGHDRPLYDIRKPEIVEWASKLVKQGLGNSTIKTYLSTLASNYTLATDWGRIPDDRVNPFQKVKLPSKPVDSYKFMPDQMLTKILNQLEPEFHIQAILARNIGCRITEMFESTIETHDGIVCLNMVDGKNAFSSRLVPIPLFMVDEVVATKAQWPSNVRYGAKFSTAKLKVIDDKQLAFHSLRGTFITHAGRAGFTEQTIAWLVGHADGKGRGHTGKTYFKGYTLEKMQELVEATPQYRPK